MLFGRGPGGPHQQGGRPAGPLPRGYSLPRRPAGIIDLSQVPHLPVLVPPTPGTPATAMDRLAYLPAAPQHFSSRLSSSPLSPGNVGPGPGPAPARVRP